MPRIAWPIVGNKTEAKAVRHDENKVCGKEVIGRGITNC